MSPTMGRYCRPTLRSDNENVVAVSGLIKEMTKSIIRVPSELTSHSQVRGTYREGAAIVKLATVVIDADAIVGQLTLTKAHITSR